MHLPFTSIDKIPDNELCTSPFKFQVLKQLLSQLYIYICI